MKNGKHVFEHVKHELSRVGFREAFTHRTNMPYLAHDFINLRIYGTGQCIRTLSGGNQQRLFRNNLSNTREVSGSQENMVFAVVIVVFVACFY